MIECGSARDHTRAPRTLCIAYTYTHNASLHTTVSKHREASVNVHMTVLLWSGGSVELIWLRFSFSPKSFPKLEAGYALKS